VPAGLALRLTPTHIVLHGYQSQQTVDLVSLSCRRLAGSPGLLLGYRLTMLAWALFIGLRQLATKGTRVFVFYTGKPFPPVVHRLVPVRE
jgi:hypothetical protein